MHFLLNLTYESLTQNTSTIFSHCKDVALRNKTWYLRNVELMFTVVVDSHLRYKLELKVGSFFRADDITTYYEKISAWSKSEQQFYNFEHVHKK